MNKTESLPQSLETKDIEERLKQEGLELVMAALSKAFARTRTPKFKPTVMAMMINDIREITSKVQNFGAMEVAEAIKRGSLGEMGVTVKLTPQVIYTWIIAHSKKGRVECLTPADER